jgi:tRNA (guanine37-N1)-methyltransferase
MHFDILSIFPEAFSGFFSVGVLAQAVEKGLIEIHLHDLRDFTDDPHRVVDDRPYGGGAGMVMKVDTFVRAIDGVIGGVRSSFLTFDPDEDALQDKVGQKTRPDPVCQTVLLSSQGRLFTQEDAIRWAKLDGLILLCGRYEGVDERLISFIDEEVSIGDYVLTGGEVAAAAVIEATARMVPGVVGKFESVETDSFYRKTRLGPPQYTRPPVFRGLSVPEVLLSGDHAKIEAFRERSAWEKTMRNRPDLLGVHLDRDSSDG